jgi:hypothetical protein
MKLVTIPFFLMISFFFSACSSPTQSNSKNFSLKFNGSNSYVEFPFAEQHDLFYDFSIELWIKFETRGTGKLLSKVIWSDPGDSVSSYSIYFDENESNKIVFSTLVGEAPIDVHKAISSIALTAQKWHHIAVTYSEASYTKNIYIDGVLAYNEDNTGDIRYNGRPLIVGAFKTNSGDIISPYNGNIDEIRIWGKTLSVSDINANMNNLLLGRKDALLGYWNFNEGEGNTVNDITDFKVDGTISNAAWDSGYK